MSDFSPSDLLYGIEVDLVFVFGYIVSEVKVMVTFSSDPSERKDTQV